MIEKNLRKIIEQLLSRFCMLKKKKYITLMFRNITQILNSFDDSKWRRIALSYSKELSPLLRGITSKHHGNFYCMNCLYSFATKIKC